MDYCLPIVHLTHVRFVPILDPQMSDPHARLLPKKGNEMFVYQITTTDGYVARVTCEGDPTEHPAFYGRVLDVVTIGEAGLNLV